MSNTVRLTDFHGVRPGGTATLRVPVGPGSPTIDAFHFQLGGGMQPQHIASVKGLINGRLFMDEGTGIEIQDRDDYRGLTTSPQYLTLDFTEPGARNGAGEQLMASIPGHLCNSLHLQLELTADAPALGTIEATMDYRQPTNNPNIRKMFVLPHTFNRAGTASAPLVMYLPKGPNEGSLVKRLWLKETTHGNVQGVEIRVANTVQHTVTREQLEFMQRRHKLQPQNKLCVIDFIADGNLAGVLPTVKYPECELRLITAIPEDIKVYAEVLDAIGRL